MRLFSVFFLLGTLLIQLFPQLPSNLWVALLLCLSIVMTLFWEKRSEQSEKLIKPFIKPLTRMVSAVLAGLLLASLVAQHQLNQRIPHQWEGKDLILQGRVLGVPNNKDDGIRFRFKVQQAFLASKLDKTTDKKLAAELSTKPEQAIAFTGVVRLGWFQNKQLVNADEQWRLRVRLKQPSGFLNPGGFDYEKWLFSERIIATGYIRQAQSETDNQRTAASPVWSVNRLRQGIHARIQANVSDPSSAAVLSALLVAVRTELSDSQWKTLQQTGTSHLVAISGLHIAVVAGFAFLPVMLLWWLFPKLNEKIPRRVAGAIVGVVFASAYAMLAGFNLPTQRALLMVVVALLGLLWRRHYGATTIMSLALLAVLLLDPLAGMSISFWLSFLAVGLILLVLKRQTTPPWLMVIRIQLVLSIAMLPLTLLFFGSASLVSPVANLFAIPWVSLVVVPLSLLALLLMPLASGFSDMLLGLASKAVALMFAGFEWLSQLSLADVAMAEIPRAYLLVAFLGILFLLLPKAFPARWLGLVALLPAILFQPSKPQQGEFVFTLLDAGQGMASVLRTQNHSLVYDVGTRYSSSYDLGKLVVLPYLKAKGIRRLDRLVLSHDDIDHTGGAGFVLNNLSVAEVMSSEPSVLEGLPLIESHTIKACNKGDHWRWDGVDFEMLSPVGSSTTDNDNNRSCVLRVSNQHHSLLLTGDIQRKVESQLNANFSREDLHSEVITMPHHGSKTSSSLAFLQHVSPQLALIPVGYRNRFGHPKAAVLARYQQQGITILDTARQGAITVQFPANEQGYRLEKYRSVKRGFWSRQ